MTFKSAFRDARLRAPLLATIIFGFSGCNSSDLLTSDSPNDTPAEVPTAVEADAPELSAFAGGIPMGSVALPTTWFGSPYNGALRNIWPQALTAELAGIKRRGGRILLMMVGNERHYKDAASHFSMSKWKARVDRFRHVNFNSYIKDGTIMAHYLIDEPTDPKNWGGRPVTPAQLEEMARYSKRIWPNMATIVRSQPTVLGTRRYSYLDAAWAQYLYRKGPASDYIRREVARAQQLSLGLVVGLNVLRGSPSKGKMTATQIRSAGSALLSSNYPCAFLNWTYDSRYLSQASIKDAMRFLRAKAQSRAQRSCRG